MESVYAYDRDRDYVPNANELAAFDLMKREMDGPLLHVVHHRSDYA
jgi:hypothetical protein